MVLAHKYLSACTWVFAALGSPTLLGALGSRMFFNIKEAAESDVDGALGWDTHCLSTIRFGDTSRSGER